MSKKIFISEKELNEFQRIVEQVNNAKTENFIELAKILNLDPKKDFTNANLTGVDLSNLDLREANFSGTDFRGANLQSAKLDKAIFKNANFSGFPKPDYLKFDAILSYILFLKRIKEKNVQTYQYDIAEVLKNISLLTSVYQQNINDLKILVLIEPYVDVIENEQDIIPFCGANFTNTALEKTNFENANLAGVNFSDSYIHLANVKNAKFENNIGISLLHKRELIKRGAIFQNIFTEFITPADNKIDYKYLDVLGFDNYFLYRRLISDVGKMASYKSEFIKRLNMLLFSLS